jgi:hypothetical protein
VVKLHGDQESGFNCLTSKEITGYEEPVQELIASYSTRTAVVCGYSFFHLNVLKAFSARGAPLFLVNRAFPEAPMVLSLLWARCQTTPLVIDGGLGTFDEFIRRLAGELGVGCAP